MKYKNREVDGFSVGVELGKNKIGNKLSDFKNNEKFVANILRQLKIDGWSYAEAPIDDLVEITPSEIGLEPVNTLFSKVKEVFEKVSILVLYKDFDENDTNLEEIYEPLNIELFTVRTII